MSTYTPDRWVMLEIAGKNSEPIRKIFAGWYGGFMGSDSWKLNSGVVAVRTDGDYFEFDGQSGSTYCCHAGNYGMSGYMHSVLTSWRTMYPNVDFREIDLEMIVES